uniref:NADH-ubiquinone oxidoreductase chain 5 n=1 Tax=Neopetrolisthes maculatus TaxID=941218 RepID=L0EAI5_9EUCA|nr:NADH dehydrogenase subunit 5 [Neopetrolisthes maculatus]AGA56149.1 NADH dehydrogenase subunit 5 [Neopetrolisthes maculatus]
MVVWNILLNFISMVFLLIVSFSSLTISLWQLMFNKCFIIEWEFLSLNSTSVVVTYIFDSMSLTFLGFVTFISSMVLFYSGDYMAGDYNVNRFIYLVLAFVFSMVILIISPNLISILLGWDGLGLVSYALVIYYQNEKSANAGMLTVLSNRIGDVMILLSIGLMMNLGDWNFVLISNYLSKENFVLMMSLVTVAAMTKSAQIPFSAWLPAAMAAPTPVSALVHSSTLVTAGVYLMIRFSDALMDSVKTWLLLISCLTMFMSGLGANFEYDLKKIIALSTLSQLGVMLSILALGFSNLAFFHLLSHALFKALLFMCAGVVIHNVKEFQDIRYMGNLSKFMPLTSMMMNLANLALCGFPFLAGFYSKDLILEVAALNPLNMISFVLYVLSTSLTVCYTFRLIYYSMFGNFNLLSCSNISDESKIMTNPMLGLSCGAIFMGSILSWLMFPEIYMICMTLSMKTLFLLVSLLGALIGYWVNFMTLNFKLFSLKFYMYSCYAGSMWNLPFLSTFNLNYLTLSILGKNFVLMDKGWSEFIGGQGLYSTLAFYSYNNQILQDNNLKIFMKMFLFSFLILLMF